MDPSSILGGTSFWNLGATWLLNYLLHSTLLLGAVWLLSRSRFLSPAFQDILWKAALIGGLVTAGVHTLGMGGEPLGGRWMVESPAPASPDAVFFSETAGSSEIPFAVFMPAENEFVASPENRSLPQWLNRVRTGTRQGWPQAMLMVWVLGGTLCLARLLWLRYRLGRRLRSRTELKHGPLFNLFRRMCCASGLNRRVRLTVSDRVGGPLAWGRSEICLPRRALVDLTSEQQQNVLAHEMAHLVRRDPTWRWCGALLEAIFFFQPLNRAARRGIHESAEYLCDDWAVRMTGQSLVMAKCLVEVAGWLRPLPAPAPVAGMAEHGSPLVRRVERLLKRDPASPGLSVRWPILAALGLVAAAAWISPGFVPDVPRPADIPFTAEIHPEHPGANTWVQDPFEIPAPERGGLFQIPPASESRVLPSPRTLGRPATPPAASDNELCPEPKAAPRVPFPRFEPQAVPAEPRIIRWEWKEVRRPARVLTRVNHVQVPEELQRRLQALEVHVHRNLRPQVQEWRRLLGEELLLEIQLSESGLEVQVQPSEMGSAPKAVEVLDISSSLEKAREFLDHAREFERNEHEVRLIREELRRRVEETRDSRFTFLLI